MVTIGMNYKVLEGRQDAFIAMFNRVLEAMLGIDGHRVSHLYRDVQDPSSFLIVSEWDRKEPFDAFIRSETFAKVATWGREQILAARPQHRVFEEKE